MEQKSDAQVSENAVKEPSAAYSRNTEIPTFFGTPMLRGSFAEINPEDMSPDTPVLFYTHPNGEIWVGDAVAWLRSLEGETVDLVFADPPYNIKKAEWDTFESQQAYVEWSLQWIEQVARVLKPTGTLYVCGFSEILADIKLPALRFFKGCRWLISRSFRKLSLTRIPNEIIWIPTRSTKSSTLSNRVWEASEIRSTTRTSPESGWGNFLRI